MRSQKIKASSQTVGQDLAFSVSWDSMVEIQAGFLFEMGPMLMFCYWFLLFDWGQTTLSKSRRQNFGFLRTDHKETKSRARKQAW